MQDLTIRLLGRPRVTKDDPTGYHKIQRKYVIEGYRSEYSEINHPNNPLFLAVGTEDEEFSNHYLTNQAITPKDGSVDSAYITREFTQIRNTWSQESVSTSNDLKRIRRSYVVLRAKNNSIGYSSTSWANHPSQGGDAEPWDYLPAVIKAPSYSPYAQTYSNTIGGKTPTLGADNTSLYDILAQATHKDAVNSSEWLPGYAQVSTTQPGVDVWSVEWVTHSTPYWTTGTSRQGGSTPLPKSVDFDSNGLRISSFGSGGSGGSFNQVGTYVFFVTADVVPPTIASYWGGGASMSPSVMLDCSFINFDDSTSSNFTKPIPNAIFKQGLDTTSGFSFPTVQEFNSNPAQGSGSIQAAASGSGSNTIVFKGDLTKGAYEDIPEQQYYVKAKKQVTVQAHKKLNYQKLPCFKGIPIRYAGGTVSWTHGYSVGGSYAQPVSVKVRPLFSSGNRNVAKKIWQVAITYVG